ncbi:hypothetical protein J6590_067357 [Homalodisca vitripennis]|nr:hypothetical protein J6590_067357 [Homalodisca vitripennis]
MSVPKWIICTSAWTRLGIQTFDSCVVTLQVSMETSDTCTRVQGESTWRVCNNSLSKPSYKDVEAVWRGATMDDCQLFRSDRSRLSRLPGTGSEFWPALTRLHRSRSPVISS